MTEPVAVNTGLARPRSPWSVILLSITLTFRRCDGGKYNRFIWFFAVYDPLLQLTLRTNCCFYIYLTLHYIHKYRKIYIAPQSYNEQEAFEKCWAHSPLRAATLPFTRCRNRRRLRIDVHDDANDDDDNDNAWQRGPLRPHGMVPIRGAELYDRTSGVSTVVTSQWGWVFWRKLAAHRCVLQQHRSPAVVDRFVASSQQSTHLGSLHQRHSISGIQPQRCCYHASQRQHQQG